MKSPQNAGNYRRMSFWRDVEEEEETERLEDAEMYIINGIKGRANVDLSTHEIYQLYTYYHSKYWSIIFTFSCVLYMMAAVFEPSSTFENRFEENVYNQYYIIPIKIICLLLLWADIYMEIRLLPNKLTENKETILIAILLLLESLTTTIQFFVPRIPLITRLLRPLFLVHRKRNVRSLFFNISEVLPRIANILILIIFLILIFGIIGFIIMGGISFETCDIVVHENYSYCSVYNPLGCTDYFGDFFSSVYQFYILTTSDNHPTVTHPAYHCNKLYMIIFVSFVFIVKFIFLNILTASIYAYFQENTLDNILDDHKKISHNLEIAFDILCDQLGPDPSVTIVKKSTYMKLMKRMKPKLSDEVVDLCYKSVFFIGKHDEDTLSESTRHDDVDYLTLQQFQSLIYSYHYLVADKKKVEEWKYIKKGSTIYKLIVLLKKLMERKFMLYILDLLLIVHTFCILYDVTAVEKSAFTTKFQDAFLWYSFVDLILKLMAYGIRKYWSLSPLNKIDTIAIFGTFISFITQSSGFLIFNSVSSILLLLRTARLLRLLRFVYKFNLMIYTLNLILSAVMRYMVVILCVYYTYSIIGMECFSGKLQLSNSAIDNTSYSTLNYFVNNFNSLPNAMVVLWEQQIGNNWGIVTDGASTSYGSTFVRLYFVIWTVIINYVLINIILAFFLDSYNLILNKQSYNKKYKDLSLYLLEKTAKNYDFPLDDWIFRKEQHEKDIYHEIFRDDIHRAFKQFEHRYTVKKKQKKEEQKEIYKVWI